ncbi:MAG: AMP-binding protein [Sphingobium sp.]
MTTIADLVQEKAAASVDADRPILTFVTVGPGGALEEETRSYAELDANGARLAGWLSAQGLKAGDCFAIMMNNHPEFVEAMIAAARLGLVWVPVDSRTMGDKLSYMLAHAGCRGVIAADYCLDALAAAAPGLPALEWILTLGEGDRDGLTVTPYARALETATAPATDVDGQSAMFLMYTSGTTGNPKAVVQTHQKYMAARKGMTALGIGPGDAFYTGLSLTHINAQGTLRSGLALGLPVVISRKFTKSRLWDICRAYGCTTFNLLGGMIPEVFAAPPRPDDADNPVRLIISAGMPESLWNAYRERFGIEICEVYGATEGGGAMFNPPPGKVGSMGKPDPSVEAGVFDEEDNRLGPNQPGELRFRRKDGQSTRVAYYRNEDASAAKVAGGWFRSGDIVHYDEEGWFFYHHRVGGGVRRNGDFVNTALVESVISRSPLVDDVYVFGVGLPRNVAGEKTLVALVVPADPDHFDEAALRDYCATALERNDVPEIIHAAAAIPKTVSEKPVERDAIALLRRDGVIPDA